MRVVGDVSVAVEGVLKLFPGGRVPRRAAVVDGTVRELRDAAATAAAGVVVSESPDVSALCDVVRVARGETCWSRTTAALLDQALATNSADAWAAAADDLDTGHFDVRAAAAATDASRATSLALCVCNALSTVHLLHVVRVAAAVLPRLEREALRAAGAVLGADIPKLAGRVGTLVAALRREQREAVMDAVGRAVAAADVPGPVLDAAVADLARRGRIESLRLFSSTAMGRFVSTETFGELVRCAAQAGGLHRPGALAAVARCVAENPDLASTCPGDLARLVGAAFGGDDVTDVDLRSALAASVVARRAFDCPVIRRFAEFSERACVQLLSRRDAI